MRRVSSRIVVVAAAVTAASAWVQSSANAAVSWSGTGGVSWATGSSWSNGSGPSTADTVNFTDTGSTNQPNEVTSLLNTSRTIGGLSITNSASKFHTLDLGTNTLTVAGNFNFNLDQNSNTTTTIRNGSININSGLRHRRFRPWRVGIFDGDRRPVGRVVVHLQHAELLRRLFHRPRPAAC